VPISPIFKLRSRWREASAALQAVSRCLQQTNVSQLVSELVLGYKSMAGKGVTLMERIAPDVPKEVLVDPLRVKQILSNGLTNALKQTSEGGVLLQVR
jgi:signal transduction histidine kinase